MYRTSSLAMITTITVGLFVSACGGASEKTIKQSENNTHFDSMQPDPHTHVKPTAKPITNGQRFARTLDAHNKVRRAHGLSNLTWSASLASYAQDWANHLASSNNCHMRHRPMGSPHGENLWWASPRKWSNGLRELQEVDIHRVVKDWADEKQFYNYNRNSCKPGEQCGHYTQIVWKETTQVGCAYQQCGDLSQLWVCNYNPPGNYIGERPY